MKSPAPGRHRPQSAEDMYSEYFDLQETPFSIAPDPRYLYLGERHREALAHLTYGVGATGGFVLLTGEVGTGKTTVCRCLLEQLPEQTQVAYIVNPRLSALELLATICDELGIAYPQERPGNKLLIDRLNAFLLDSHARGRQTVLIIDEAQNLSPEVLEQVRLLTNLETSRRKLLQIVMLGQPELRRLLARPELRQLAQRITARYHLEPLSRPEVAAYIGHRLTVAGGRRPLFSPRLIGRIYRLTGGIPRRINILCDRALLGAYVRGQDRVSGRILAEAARELAPEGARRSFGLRPLALLAVVVALLALIPSFLDLGSLPPVPIAAPGRQAILPVPAPPAELPPAANAPATAAVLEWPEELPLSRSRETAYEALLATWGLTYESGGQGTACDFAESQGLACLYRRGSLGSLRQLDRPAVLTLVDERREQFHAALVGLSADTATFILAGRQVRVPVQLLEQRWFGDYTLLWRRPPFAGMVRPGDRGPAVDWLNRQIAVIQNRPEPPRGGALEGPVLVRLKEFQRTRGLNPDGLVGPNTLIHLDSALGGGSPRLAREEEGS